MDTVKRWESFGKRYNKSFSAVFRVAEYIHSAWNESVMIKAKNLAPDYSSASQYLDNGDIHLKDKRTIEVKHNPKTYFTNVDDYPYPEIIVANVKPVDRNESAIAYFIVNAPMTHAAIIRIETKSMWVKKNILDRERESSEEKYLCSKHLVEFVDLRIS